MSHVQDAFQLFNEEEGVNVNIAKAKFAAAIKETIDDATEEAAQDILRDVTYGIAINPTFTEGVGTNQLIFAIDGRPPVAVDISHGVVSIVSLPSGIYFVGAQYGAPVTPNELTVSQHAIFNVTIGPDEPS